MDLQASFEKDRNCSGCPIRHRAVCATCDEDEILVLDEMKYYRSFDAGQPIMWAGDPMAFVGSVVSGTATIERLMEDGRKQTMGLLLPSDFIGRPGRETATYDVTAVTDVTLCCFRRDSFEKMVEATPHVAQRLMEMALDELDAARDWMLLLGRKTAREKIATFLMMIVRRTSEEKTPAAVANKKISLPLTREAMADYMGLTLETVSRQFSKLRKDGLIVMDGKRVITIPDVGALQAETGSDLG
ncbi:Crp/Fnr family transcriptional regulator [Loktanella sp. F6476L]|uniref:transcriptional regulator FnrL n=1 Tax=Loktanella sp. F6476L TaxID=2926405 RepID=UPI001FF3F9FF|nr:Crp/Fnr family transcriptional regulator [Loktanella sp. F6476L]MCK0120030.1 Crp/Fnr family transcriptional regulator [Loktanella sp. F6476L]